MKLGKCSLCDQVLTLLKKTAKCSCGEIKLPPNFPREIPSLCCSVNPTNWCMECGKSLCEDCCDDGSPICPYCGTSRSYN